MINIQSSAIATISKRQNHLISEFYCFNEGVLNALCNSFIIIMEASIGVLNGLGILNSHSYESQ